MASLASTAGTYAPPSTRQESTLLTPGALATGYELECLTKLNEAYIDARNGIQTAIDRLNEWGPSWGSRHSKLDDNFSAADKILAHMRINLSEENRRFARAKEQREYWEAYLPPNGSTVSESSVNYRMERIEEWEQEETVSAFKIEMLKERITAQEALVDDLYKEVVPSRSVVYYAQSSHNLFTSMQKMLHQEYLTISGRLRRPIDAVPAEVWANIFRYAIDSQEEECVRTLATGLVPDSLMSPRQTALSIAAVSRTWRVATLLGDGNAIWRPVLVDASNLSRYAVTTSPAPGHNPTDQGPLSISATIITYAGENLMSPNPPLLEWIRHFHVASLRMMYRNTPFLGLNPVLRLAADKGSLRSLAMICQDAEFPDTISLLDSGGYAALHSLELVDIDLVASSLPSEMNEMKSLWIRYTRPLPAHKRPRSAFLYELLSKFPALEQLEVDLFFEDTPMFVPVQFPSPYNALSHLRTLSTRFSYFQNSLLFLRHLPLLALDSMALVSVPSCTSGEAWKPVKLLLATSGRGARIRKLDILHTLPETRGLFDAGFITSELPNLQELGLHRGAVDHFIVYFVRKLKEDDFPLLRLSRISFWDAKISEDGIMEFVRMYCDTVLQRPTDSIGATTAGGTPGCARHGQLQSVEFYRCEGISSSTLNEIDSLLRTGSPSWERVRNPSFVPTA